MRQIIIPQDIKEYLQKKVTEEIEREERWGNKFFSEATGEQIKGVAISTLFTEISRERKVRGIPSNWEERQKLIKQLGFKVTRGTKRITIVHI